MKKQSGFSAVEGLLLLVIVGIIGFVGWYVWHSKQNVDKVSMQAVTNSDSASFNKKYTDTAKVYSLSYPSNWKLSYQEIGGGEGNRPTPDWTKESRGIMLLPSGIPKNDSFAREVDASVSPVDDSTVVSHQKAEDRFHTVTKMKISGYDAYLDHLDFVGPSAAEKYTDDYYVIIHGDKAITVSFREKWYHNSGEPITNWDDSKYLPAVKDIVNSIKFMN